MWNLFNKNKKGQAITVSNAPALALSLGLLVIMSSIVALIVGAVQDTQTVDSVEYNISNSGLGLFTNFSDQFGTIGIVAGAGLIIGLLVASLGVYLFSRR